MGRQGETRPLGRRTHHPTKGNKKGKGDKGRQDPREGGHTIQQTETRRCTREQGETRGDKTIGKADTPCDKGKQEGRQGETRGDKTLGKADTPSNTKADTLRKH